MALSNETLRAVRKHGRDGGELDKLSRKLYGISGTALLAKLIKGESGDRNEAVSSAGARGKGQFMPGTRQEVLKKFGVDPWKDSDSAAKAASLHLRGKLGHRTGLAGYNPGGGQSYVDYILGQKVGDVRQGGKAAKAPKAPGGAAPAAGELTRTVKEVTPGVDNSAVRQQLLQQYLGERGRPDALLSLALGLRNAQDVPGSEAVRTTTEKLPGGEPKGKVRGTTGGAKSAVEWARSTVGEAERSGSNRSPRIDQWQARFGMTAQAWCAMWTSLAATKGGMPKAGRTASVAEVRRQAQQKSGGYTGFVDPRKARPGDLILFGNDHIGMVEENTGKGLVMIAGNDSNKVNRRTVAYGKGDVARPRYKR